MEPRGSALVQIKKGQLAPILGSSQIVPLQILGDAEDKWRALIERKAVYVPHNIVLGLEGYFLVIEYKP